MTYKCHVYDCPNTIYILEPMTGNFTCREHTKEILPKRNKEGYIPMQPKCDLCGERGCHQDNHKKDEPVTKFTGSIKIEERVCPHVSELYPPEVDYCRECHFLVLSYCQILIDTNITI
jgi:hypothetical protein